MKLFEILFILNSILLLLLVCFGRSRWQLYCVLSGLVILAFHAVFESLRWQMGFCYLVFIINSLMIWKRSRWGVFLRSLGFIFGLLLIATSAFYSHMMPVLDLPEPSGAFKVGTTSLTIVDTSRNETHTANVEDYREVFIEIWYPADLTGNQPPPAASLWQELYQGDTDAVSLLTGYLSEVSTHSYLDAAPAFQNGPFPVILFNHGLQMFTAQNTMLMEHLASHGYVMVSIAHPYESLRVNLSGGTVLPEFVTSFENFRQGLSWMEKSSAPINAAVDSMQAIRDPQLRKSLMLNTLKDAELNQVVSRWEKDTRFVLEELVSHSIELPVTNILDTTRIGIMGMSLGGAVSAELSKVDHRIKAAVNIDGLQYGNRNNIGLKVPFMMLYSKDGAGLNEFLMLDAESDFHEITFPEARHADFSDMTIIWPVMGVYGQLGKITGKRMLELTNRVVTNFWDHYLKHQPLLQFSEQQYPEIQYRVKYQKQADHQR